MQTGVLIYEDNESLRESVMNMLKCSEDILVLGAFSSPVKVEKQLVEIAPDVILMDIDMPGMSGIEAVRLIRKTNRDVVVIMLTIFDDNQHVLDAIFAGASGYLQKKHISEKLLGSIREALNGGAPMSPAIARLVIQSMHQKHIENENKYNLTPREKEILLNLSKGNSYKLIASELEISIDTVRTHIKRIYDKLQVHSQTEAVSKAVNERLV